MDHLPYYLERIGKAMPELALNTVEENSEGLANDVVIVDKTWVFRFPKSGWAQEALYKETQILKLVRSRLPLPVPRYAICEQDMVAYRFIPGEAFLRTTLLRLSDAEQEALARQLAEFLVILHGIPQMELDEAGIPYSDARRSVSDWAWFLESLKNELFPHMMAHARRTVVDYFEPVLSGKVDMNYSPVLINGDLGPYHILFQPKKKRLSGIIDFGTAGLGDPAVDYACLLYNLGEGFVRRMSHYDPKIVDLIDRARFWCFTVELQWALGGVRDRDLSWFMIHLGGGRDVRPLGMPF